MPETKQPITPTLDKISILRPKSEAIGEFLEWCGEQGYELCKYREYIKEICFRCKGETPKIRYLARNEHSDPDEPKEPCNVCYGSGYEGISSGDFPIYTSINNLLSKFLEIDEQAAEQERRAILEHIRELSNGSKIQS